MSKFERTKTMPWSDDEFITVDGMKLVYEKNKITGTVHVKFPGCVSKSVSALISQGRKVVMPRRLRE